MAMTPHVQQIAQRELDAVVGRKRLPTVEDMQSLPYIQAIVLETLRWMPVLPLSVPHRSLEDDWYQGKFIPGGTELLPVSLAYCIHSSVSANDSVVFRTRGK